MSSNNGNNYYIKSNSYFNILNDYHNDLSFNNILFKNIISNKYKIQIFEYFY